MKFKHLGDAAVDAYATAKSGDSLLVEPGQTMEVPGTVLKTATKKQLEDAGLIRKEGGETIEPDVPQGMAYYALPDESVELMPDDATYVELPNGDLRAFPKATWEPDTKQSKAEKADATSGPSAS